MAFDISGTQFFTSCRDRALPWRSLKERSWAELDLTVYCTKSMDVLLGSGIRSALTISLRRGQPCFDF